MLLIFLLVGALVELPFPFLLAHSEDFLTWSVRGLLEEAVVEEPCSSDFQYHLAKI